MQGPSPCQQHVGSRRCGGQKAFIKLASCLAPPSKNQPGARGGSRTGTARARCHRSRVHPTIPASLPPEQDLPRTLPFPPQFCCCAAPAPRPSPRVTCFQRWSMPTPSLPSPQVCEVDRGRHSRRSFLEPGADEKQPLGGERQMHHPLRGQPPPAPAPAAPRSPTMNVHFFIS